jgi:hypothetical protein
MARPAFELFESICVQLRDAPQFVLTERALPATLVAELKRAFRQPVFEDALQSSINWLTEHFNSKGSQLPFRYEHDTGVIETVDAEFMQFVRDMLQIRTTGKQSKTFETAVCSRLSQKLQSGDFHNVGWPRATRRRLTEIVQYLQGLGFDGTVLRGRDKDGGLDILWLPPLGSVPIRPVVSFQCKNSRFRDSAIREAHQSAVIASRSIARHSCMRSHGVYMCYVIFNDYLDSTIRDMATGLSYAPLGLSDLARLTKPLAITQL